MYIAILHLEGFQNHRDTTLYLSPAVNILVGETQCGKSDVMRALAWLLFNDYQCSEFSYKRIPLCRVTAVLDDDTTIIRERQGEKDRYILTNREGVTRTFQGFVNTPPAAILEAHGMRQVVTAGMSPLRPQLAGQFARPFLLAEGPARRAIIVKHLSGAHLLQSAAALANSTEDGSPLQVCHLLSNAATMIVEQTVTVLERIVNLALEAVFGPGYTFQVNAITHSSEEMFYFRLTTPDGMTFSDANLCRSNGGGLVHLIGLALRLALLSAARPYCPGPLILDEPACYLSDLYISRFARFLKLISQDLGRQMVVLTHNQRLTAAADCVYILSKNGGQTDAHYRGRVRKTAFPHIQNTVKE